MDGGAGAAGEKDEALEQMVRDGTLRGCPQCGMLTMKEYGICNVIQCERCSIWWNWRSKEASHTDCAMYMSIQRVRESPSMRSAGACA